eukprot:341998-Prymnesium_polylepis.1
MSRVSDQPVSTRVLAVQDQQDEAYPEARKPGSFPTHAPGMYPVPSGTSNNATMQALGKYPRN